MKKCNLYLLFVILTIPINELICDASTVTNSSTAQASQSKNKPGLSDEEKVTIIASGSAIGAILFLFLGKIILEVIRNSDFFVNWGLEGKSRAAYKEYLEQLSGIKAGQIDQILSHLDQFMDSEINQKDLKNIARTIVDLNDNPLNISDIKIDQLNRNIERLIKNNVKGIKLEDLNLIKQDVVEQLINPENRLYLRNELTNKLIEKFAIPQQEIKVAAESLPGQMPNAPEPVKPLDPANLSGVGDQPGQVGTLDMGEVEVDPFKPLQVPDVAPPGGPIAEFKPVEPVGF